jgi:hypothetical protein
MKSTLGEEASGYHGQIRAWMRKQQRWSVLRGGWSWWTPLKNGFGSMLLAISAESVEIYPTAIPRLVAHVFGLHHRLVASDVTLADARIGLLGTPLLAKDVLLLSWQRNGRRIRLAVRPYDGDLERLAAALLAAGVSPTTRSA